jgi:putative ABC transport system permease protein
MFLSYFKIAWRNLRKDRQFTFLNLFGLSIGLASSLLIYFWVSYQWNIDKFHKNNRQLFEVMSNVSMGDATQTMNYTPGILAHAMVKELPEVEDAAVTVSDFAQAKGIVSVHDSHIKGTQLFASRNFFNVFSYTLIEGDSNKVLSDRSGVLLSDQLALKLFHTTSNIIGRSVEWKPANDNLGKTSGLYAVSGIFKTPPSNSSLQFDILFPFDLYFEKNTKKLENWANDNVNTYIVLKKGTDVTQFNNKIRDFSRAKLKGTVDAQYLSSVPTLFVQRYADRFLFNRYENGVQTGGRIENVRLFSIIALFILCIACINFMNLSTAKASSRLKDVGIRKVVGARRSALVIQYLIDSLLLTFLSLLVALVLIWLVFPSFREIAGRDLTISFDLNMILSIICITFFTGVLAGSYPAFYLSGFKPIAIFKGKLVSSFTSLWLRKGLVIFQFSLSAIFIISVWVIYKQMQLIETKNLGYVRDNVITFKNDGALNQSLPTFLEELKKTPGVTKAAISDNDLTGHYFATTDLSWPGKKADQSIQFAYFAVGYDWTELLGIKILSGRSFSRAFGADSTNLILNKAAADAMELKDPVGKTVKLWGTAYQILGVVDNFQFESLHESVKPCFLYLSPGGNVLARLRAGREKETISNIEELYHKYNPGLAFDFRFLDQDYQAIYDSEERVAALSRYFAGIAIAISCLGLFGLAAFTAQKRQKEIGIRKIVGATAADVAVMLSKDFLKLVLIAIILAFPLSWWIMSRWLSSFAYRTNLNVWIFLLSGVSTMLIALLAVSFQTIKAALTNPVKALRSE